MVSLKKTENKSIAKKVINLEIEALRKLKKSIEKLINDNNLREKLSKNGLLVAKENFSTTKSLDSFSKFILQTLN